MPSFCYGDYMLSYDVSKYRGVIVKHAIHMIIIPVEHDPFVPKFQGQGQVRGPKLHTIT